RIEVEKLSHSQRQSPHSFWRQFELLGFISPAFLFPRSETLISLLSPRRSTISGSGGVLLMLVK
ncbi:hypothetical protein TorRG33x02_193820, partial [Trema orientale]